MKLWVAVARHNLKWVKIFNDIVWKFNRLTGGAEYTRFFGLLLPHYVPHFKHVQDKM